MLADNPHHMFGASFNVAGLTVNTTPVSLTLGGQTGGSNALGTLVCNVLSTLTNVANLTIYSTKC